MKYFLLIPFFFLLSACGNHSGNTAQRFYTWDGLEPDRWASIWLVKRHVFPQAVVTIVPVGAQLSGAEAIVTPTAVVKRTRGVSSYENMVVSYRKDGDAGLMRLGKIINELEIAPWRSSTPAVAVVERQFRALQYRFNRTRVPYDCYAGFFDSLYGVLKTAAVSDEPAWLESLASTLAVDNVCQGGTDSLVVEADIPVMEYPVSHVLKMIHAGKNVVFVDTREDDEFDETHIPGAINLKLREVDAASAKQFEQADLVISYCIKDFRGYEVALALHKVGVNNVGIMRPFGLKGWKGLDLPVASSKVSDRVALDELKKRAASGV